MKTFGKFQTLENKINITSEYFASNNQSERFVFIKRFIKKIQLSRLMISKFFKVKTYA